MPRWLRHTFAVLSAGAAAISCTCLAGMVVIVAYQVFSRWLLNRTPYWSEETAQVLTLYFGLLGAAYAYRHRLHIRVEFLASRLRGVVGRWYGVTVDLLVFGFGASLLWWGGQLVARTWHQTLPATQLPTGISYIPLALSGLLFCAFAVEQIIEGPSPEAPGNG